MSAYQLQSDPNRQFFGVGSVVLFHAIVIYALVSGLAQKVVDVVRAPIEAKIVEEVKKEEPPPEVKIEPPKLEVPPPPFVPPPEVTIATPPPAPVITAAPTPVPEPVVPPPPVVAEAPPPPKPAVVSLTVACPKRVAPAMPDKAERAGVSGTVSARLTIKGGRVVRIDILKANPKGYFEDAVRQAVQQYTCADNGEQEVIATQDFKFELN